MEFRIGTPLSVGSGRAAGELSVERGGVKRRATVVAPAVTARISKTAHAPARIVARMPQTITATFEITGWDETRYDEPAEGPPLARATVRKRFSGPLEGTSVAELLTAGKEGYLASERVDGALDGRRGTFVLQHGGIDGGVVFGHVVPESGTGELRGLRGEAVFAHDGDGARVTLTYSL
jgi:hypothetical protein